MVAGVRPSWGDRESRLGGQRLEAAGRAGETENRGCRPSLKKKLTSWHK